MRVKFEAQLERLNVELITMGALCEEVISGAAKALLDGDSGLRETVLAAERDINQKERDIESLCMKLLLQQQPVARDLRTISSALKMISDMERIGDQASDIAELVLHLHAKSTDAVGVLEDILKMGDDVLKMVKRSIAAYVQVDLAAGAEVIAHDDVIDAAFRRIGSEIAQYIAAHPTEAETALDLFMVTKYLERLGDHAVNVAEWVEFLKTGVHKSRKIV